MADALVRKTSVTDANASYVQKLRVAEDATDDEVQAALHELFKSSPQGHSVIDIQAQVQDQLDSIQDQDTVKIVSVLASNAISKIRLDDELKNSLTSIIRREMPYAEVLTKLQAGARQVTCYDVTYKILNSLLVIHDQKQDVNLDFWRIIVPDDEGIKMRIIQELHSTPYSAHPG
ncbi:MAG: hypothetical protein OIF58_16850, partial [Cohaesibacter sp.]|nr:hypothetical protein [Cohaesibacter sp.]